MHGYVVKLCLGKDRGVQNALMDLYSRIGKIDASKYIFQTMETKDIVSWNTMITSYVVCGYHEDVLILLHKMQNVGGKDEENENSDHNYNMKVSFRPNSITLMTVRPGCAALAALTKGKEIHAYAIKNALESDVAVGSALVDMYAKCGCLDMARRVFETMPTRTVITWNVIISTYGMHGEGKEALALFHNMVAELKPNEVTFIAVFAASNHFGVVDDGRHLLHRMKVDYGLEPNADHYAYAVDLFGRAGHLDEAHKIINSMPADLTR